MLIHPQFPRPARVPTEAISLLERTGRKGAIIEDELGSAGTASRNPRAPVLTQLGRFGIVGRVSQGATVHRYKVRSNGEADGPRYMLLLVLHAHDAASDAGKEWLEQASALRGATEARVAPVLYCGSSDGHAWAAFEWYDGVSVAELAQAHFALGRTLSPAGRAQLAYELAVTEQAVELETGRERLTSDEVFVDREGQILAFPLLHVDPREQGGDEHAAESGLDRLLDLDEEVRQARAASRDAYLEALETRRQGASSEEILEWLAAAFAQARGELYTGPDILRELAPREEPPLPAASAEIESLPLPSVLEMEGAPAATPEAVPQAVQQASLPTQLETTSRSPNWSLLLFTIGAIVVLSFLRFG